MFIVFEGIDGVGKSTQAQMFVDALNKMERHTMLYREPGSTMLGNKLRQIIFNQETNNFITEFFLFLAARAELVSNIYLALEYDYNVVCDRYSYSTYAYQSDQVGWYRVFAGDYIATSGLYPELIFYLEAPYEIANARLAAKDKFDAMPKEKFDKILANYERVLTAEEFKDIRGKVVRIDATKSIWEIHEQIMMEYEKYLKELKNAMGN